LINRWRPRRGPWALDTVDAETEREDLVPPRARKGNSSEPLGFEDVLWKAADKLRGSMDASEYKHIVLGLLCVYCRADIAAEEFVDWTAVRRLLSAACPHCQRRVTGLPPRGVDGDLRHLP
jgi:hypothetical protein